MPIATALTGAHRPSDQIVRKIPVLRLSSFIKAYLGGGGGKTIFKGRGVDLVVPLALPPPKETC